MTVEIRSANQSDYDAIVSLMAQVDAQHQTAHPDRFREAARTEERAYLQNWLQDADNHMWVAESNSVVAGVATFSVRHTPAVPFIVPRRFIQLDTLVIDEHYQRQGVGAALLEAVHRWGHEQQIRDIELGVWAFNEAAIAFYRHLGYEVLYHKMGRKLR